MAEAARRAATTDGPVWILAHRQTAGHGRRGRIWAEPEGNFAATLLFCPDGSPAQLALRSFTASLALIDAFQAVTGLAAPFALKWPNDVLLNGGKVAGILLETVNRGDRPAALAIGIGVNLIAAPGPDDVAVEPRAERPVSLLQETGARVAPEAFLNHLAPAFATHEARLLRDGFGPVRDAWLGRATRLGTGITARIGPREVVGVFETVDAAGHIVLKTRHGRQAIAAADVFF